MSATIRHSALDKLDQCPCFESNPVSGPAAERGTRMDVAFRGLLMGERKTFLALTEDEQDSVMWAVSMAKDLAEGHEIVTDEALLKVKTPHLSHVGTEDARVEARSRSMDLKSGQPRSYHKQQAAYALGNMARTFATEWECVLLFCDQKEVVHYRYTYEEADAWVRGIVQSVNDPNRQPCANEYCGWCAKKDTCVAVVQPVQEAHAIMESANLAVLRDEIANDPARHARFLEINKAFESELVKPLKDLAKKKLGSGDYLPGFRLSSVKGSEYFDRVSIVRAAIKGKWGMDDLVDALGGTMSGSTFRELCEKYRTPVVEEEAKRKDGFNKVIEDKKSKK